MLVLFGAFPLWWALGLSSVIWILLAVPMLAWLLARADGSPGVRAVAGLPVLDAAQ